MIKIEISEIEKRLEIESLDSVAAALGIQPSYLLKLIRQLDIKCPQSKLRKKGRPPKIKLIDDRKKNA